MLLRLHALLLVLALLLPGTSLASHLGSYASNPVEHDDQGRSAEPDFASTSVLGPRVDNRVLDLDRDGRAAPDTALPPPGGRSLAPGCTDDAGRRPSGLCGLWTVGLRASTGLTPSVGTVPPSLAGTSGMSGAGAPGAYTPTKSSTVRFLDARLTPMVLHAFAQQVEVNAKVQDSSGDALLRAVDPNLAGAKAVGPNALWAWHGEWTDKNGNGVVDSLSDFCDANCLPGATPDGAPVRAEDEFVARGNCHRDSWPGGYNALALRSGYCALDSEAALGRPTRMVAFLFPGNHHAQCGGYVAFTHPGCAAFPADLPGRQALHLLCGAAGEVPGCFGTVPAGFFHEGDPRALDAADEARFGDPLLGPQGSVAPDGAFNDATGDPYLDARMWLFGVDWPTMFYDQSLLASLLAVVAVGCPEAPSAPQRVLLDACRFADVDAYRASSPLLEVLLLDEIKPAARGAWVLARATWIPVHGTVDGAANHQALAPHRLQGPADDAAVDPGWAREPNQPLDAFPAARHGPCAEPTAQFRGWCNDYAAHLQAPRGFGDLRLTRLATFATLGTATSLPYAGEAAGPVPLRPADDHGRTLGPGRYVVEGLFGRWHDRAQTWEESVVDLATLAPLTTHRRATADGWVGNLVNATGTFYYRGYQDEPCATEHGPGTKPYAWCHPYLDGARADAQQMAPGVPVHGEWNGACDEVDAEAVVVAPVDGVWSVPVFTSDTLGQLTDHTGMGPLSLTASCASSLPGALAALRELVLPLGNHGEAVRTTISVRVSLETVRDVDLYVGWG